MSKTVYLLQYNNYFNRTVKGESYYIIDSYTANGAKIVGQITNMSLWNPNDGIDTTITSALGLTAVPDYCVVCDGINVLQRWYVVEAKRLQGQQYRLTLRRDVIADNYTTIMSNTENYVERGWCDVANPAIYNAEPLTFNQIKKSQTLLGDRTGTPWIVGYLAVTRPIDKMEFTFSWQGHNCVISITDAALSGLNLEETPYFMFTMPLYGYHWTSPADVSQQYGLSYAAAMAISRGLSGAGTLLDIQVLPYCPYNSLSTRWNEGSCGTWYVPIADKDNNYAHLGYLNFFYEPNVFGDCVHKDENTLHGYSDTTYTIANIKKDSQTVKARIVSPNSNGVWEFVPAKSVYGDGDTISFTFRMTCMPYQPYIKVEPTFGRLYGSDYDDPRGLICGGDFSLPQINDKWNTYQINNKNYQVMFNRQIDSLDLQQSIGKAQDITGAITGTIGATVGGGMVFGGAGAAIGGIAAAAGGIADVATNAMLRADQREATIQQHNWQLGNIQALPYSVSKATNFNNEQPKVPYLEIYDATDSEKDNFDRYLALNDYSINRYGKFTDYMKPNNKCTFLRGTPIRLEAITDDAHYAAAIADEVKQGFYVGADTTNGGTN